jgi:hypothetical protein
MNPAVNLMTAVQALKLKRCNYRSVPEGTLIVQPGKPDLLLTWEAVQRFAQYIEEESCE